MPESTERLLTPEGSDEAPHSVLPSSDALPLTLVSDRTPVRPFISAPVVFPGYEILGELGRGGMGVVYRARQRNLNRLVALKVILGGPLASDETKARFHIEAEAVARLQHPNIVQVYDVGEHAGFSYMALELIEGKTLRQWQGGEPTEPRLAASLLSAIARAIQHAHEQGIVHRDLKPANILLAPVPGMHSDFATAVSTSAPTPVSSALVSRPLSGTHAALSVSPKVTDFGLAKPLEGGSDLTMTGVACGTPNYMAPEQVRGKALGAGVDVYGLGAVLFELLAGRPPFIGTDAAEVMNQILKTEPPAVRKLAPGVSRDLAVIVAKCLEKDPARRYLGARDLADDLDRFLAGQPITARPIGNTERAWRWVKRNPVVTAFLLLATIGCAVTGGLAVALAKSEADERRAHTGADVAREEAEAARDSLKVALAAAEAARQLAEREQSVAAVAKENADQAREAAKLEAERALQKQKEADAARVRAEDNLRVARGVIRVSLRELSRHPRFEEEDFKQARITLIMQARTFRDTVAQHAPNTAEWLDDLSDVSHWLGFLEYLNENQNVAAAEYRTAADAAGRWAKLEPHKPEARGRQAHSLVNAGNALFNARRFAEAETCYRDAIALVDGVVAELPRDPFYRTQAVESYGQLANVLRVTNQAAEWEKVAQVQLLRAIELVCLCGEAADHLRWLASAQMSLAKALVRVQKWDEADSSFADVVATRTRVRDFHPMVPLYSFECASALLAHANFLQTRGQNDRANDAFARAVSILEKAQAATPYVNAHCTDLASGWTQYADFLRTQRKLTEAEKLYTQAIDLTTVVIRRAPTFKSVRDAWATATIGRAHIYNQTDRHREAVAEWSKLAKEDPDTLLRSRHELFVIQSLLFAGDWKAARTAIDAQMKKEQPNWMWLDLGRVSCLVAKQSDADDTLTPAEKLKEAEKAISNAVACLEKAKLAGIFANPDQLRWYNSNTDFAPVRGKFDPTKK